MITFYNERNREKFEIAKTQKCETITGKKFFPPLTPSFFARLALILAEWIGEIKLPHWPFVRRFAPPRRFINCPEKTSELFHRHNSKCWVLSPRPTRLGRGFPLPTLNSRNSVLCLPRPPVRA